MVFMLKREENANRGNIEDGGWGGDGHCVKIPYKVCVLLSA